MHCSYYRQNFCSVTVGRKANREGVLYIISGYRKLLNIGFPYLMKILLSMLLKTFPLTCIEMGGLTLAFPAEFIVRFKIAVSDSSIRSASSKTTRRRLFSK